MLQSAEKAGLSLAKDCEMGDCQTCKCRLEEGEVVLDELAFDTLDEDEVAHGSILSCVSLPRSDVHVVLPYARADLLAKRALQARLTTSEPSGTGALRIVATLLGGARLKCNPGQYVNLSYGGVTRSYSMANGRTQENELEFHIALLEKGEMSAKLRHAVVGDSLSIHGPHGVFYLRNDDEP